MSLFVSGNHVYKIITNILQLRYKKDVSMRVNQQKNKN